MKTQFDEVKKKSYEIALRTNRARLTLKHSMNTSIGAVAMINEALKEIHVIEDEIDCDSYTRITSFLSGAMEHLEIGNRHSKQMVKRHFYVEPHGCCTSDDRKEKLIKKYSNPYKKSWESS